MNGYPPIGDSAVDIIRAVETNGTWWLDLTGMNARFLRRWTDRSCLGPLGYHHAKVSLDIVSVIPGDEFTTDHADIWPHDDPWWPTNCEACDHRFTNDDPRRLMCTPLYRRRGVGTLVTLHDAPVGAFWQDWDPDGMWRVKTGSQSIQDLHPADRRDYGDDDGGQIVLGVGLAARQATWISRAATALVGVSFLAVVTFAPGGFVFRHHHQVRKRRATTPVAVRCVEPARH